MSDKRVIGKLRPIVAGCCGVSIAALLWACDPNFNPFNPPLPIGVGEDNPFNPTPDDNPLSVDGGGNQRTTEDEMLTLTATASGGTPPYFFRWSVEVVPDDPENIFDGEIPNLVDNTNASVETAEFDVGIYIYRIVVTDSVGRFAEDRVEIDVDPEPLRATIAEAPEDDEPLMVETAVPFTLTAETNFEGEFEYRWRTGLGLGVEFSDAGAQSTEVTVASPGETTITLTILEIGGDERAASTDLDIEAVQGDAFLVRVDQPPVLFIDEPVELTASITNDEIDPDTLTYSWEITNEGRGDLVNNDQRTIEFVGRALETVLVAVTASGTINGEMLTDTEEIALVVVGEDNPEFIMTVTSENEGVSGEITFAFDAVNTPITTGNIIRYIDERFYNGVVWHRMASNNGEPFVAQFGGFTQSGEELERKDVRDSIESENEFSIGNTIRNVGLALIGNEPDSGTSQLFVNMTDNTFLDDTGFTAFGTVVAGFDLIEAMFDAELGNAQVDDGGSLQDVPVEPITILSFRRAETTPRESSSNSGGAGNVTEDEEDDEEEDRGKR